MAPSACWYKACPAFKLDKFSQTDPYLKAKIQLIPETVETGIEIEALARNARDQFEHIAEMIPSIPRELITSISTLEEPLPTVYTIANFQRMELSEAQAILEVDFGYREAPPPGSHPGPRERDARARPEDPE